MTVADVDYDVVVVGGGPAGIAAAFELSAYKVLLLEADNRLGGRLKSYDRGDYWLNVGGHLFPGEGSHIQGMLEKLALRTIPIPGSKFAVVFGGKFYNTSRVETYPLTLPMTVRERLGMIRVGLTMLRAVRNWHKAADSRPGETEAARRARMATYLGDRSFQQLIGKPPKRVEAIFRSSARRAASEMDVQSAGVAVSLFSAVWAGKKSTMALNLDGGSEHFGMGAAKALGDRVSLRSPVTRVAQDGDIVTVEYEHDGEKRLARARHAIMAVPAPIASRVVTGLPSDVASTIAKVTYGPFLAMGIMTDEQQPMPYDRVYATTTPDQSFDMFFNHANPMRQPGQRRRGGSLMVYSGGDPAAKLMGSSDAEITQTYLDDLYRLFPALKGAVKETVIQRWELGNIYRKPGMDFGPMLRYCERRDTKIHFCGDWFAELGNMEVAAGSAIEAAELVKQSLSPARA